MRKRPPLWIPLPERVSLLAVTVWGEAESDDVSVVRGPDWHHGIRVWVGDEHLDAIDGLVSRVSEDESEGRVLANSVTRALILHSLVEQHLAARRPARLLAATDPDREGMSIAVGTIPHPRQLRDPRFGQRLGVAWTAYPFSESDVYCVDLRAADDPLESAEPIIRELSDRDGMRRALALSASLVAALGTEEPVEYYKGPGSDAVLDAAWSADHPHWSCSLLSRPWGPHTSHLWARPTLQLRQGEGGAGGRRRPK